MKKEEKGKLAECYVSLDGDDMNAGTGWECAFATLKRAMEAVASDGIILFAPHSWKRSSEEELSL